MQSKPDKYVSLDMAYDIRYMMKKSLELCYVKWVHGCFFWKIGRKKDIALHQTKNIISWRKQNKNLNIWNGTFTTEEPEKN